MSSKIKGFQTFKDENVPLFVTDFQIGDEKLKQSEEYKNISEVQSGSRRRRRGWRLTVTSALCVVARSRSVGMDYSVTTQITKNR